MTALSQAVQALIIELDKPFEISGVELKHLCKAIHANLVDTDSSLNLWMDRTFEDVADSVHDAMVCRTSEAEIADFVQEKEDRRFYRHEERV